MARLTRTTGHIACAVLGLASSGCTRTISDASDPRVAILTPTVWAGEDIILTSPDFAGRDTLPLVVVGNDTLTVRFGAPDTVRAVAPLHEGAREVWITLHDRHPAPIGVVTISGAYQAIYRLPEAGGYPLVWPGGGWPTFLIATTNGLGLVNPSLRSLQTMAPDSLFSQDCYNGPGHATGGMVAIAGPATGCRLVAVDPRAPTVAQDTGPTCYRCRFSAQLAPGLWLTFAKYSLDTHTRSSGGGWTVAEIPVHQPDDVVMSPRGDRAVTTGGSRSEGIPVFGPQSAEPVFIIPHRELWGAAFTGEGDTLVVITMDIVNDSASVFLRRLRAADGSEIDSLPVWMGDCGIVLDPRGRWIYLPGFTDGWKASLQVIDRSTMHVVTTLVSEDVGNPGNLYPVYSPAEDKLYVINTCAWCAPGSATVVSIFHLQP